MVPSVSLAPPPELLGLNPGKGVAGINGGPPTSGVVSGSLGQIGILGPKSSPMDIVQTGTCTSDYCLEKLAKIYTNVGELIMQLLKFQGTQECKEYIQLEEMFTQCLLALDGLSVEGRDDLRSIRKEFINSINNYSSILKTKTQQVTIPTSSGENHGTAAIGPQKCLNCATPVKSDLNNYLCSKCGFLNSVMNNTPKDPQILEPSTTVSEVTEKLNEFHFNTEVVLDQDDHLEETETDVKKLLLNDADLEEENETSESETDYSLVSSDTSSDDDNSIYETEISESEFNDLIEDSKKPLHFNQETDETSKSSSSSEFELIQN